MNATISVRDNRWFATTWPGRSETPTSKTDFARSIAMVVFFMSDSSCLFGDTHRDDFGTSMPFKSPGGVHLIICGKVASRHFLDAAATPPGQEGRSLACGCVKYVIASST